MQYNFFYYSHSLSSLSTTDVVQYLLTSNLLKLCFLYGIKLQHTLATIKLLSASVKVF